MVKYGESYITATSTAQTTAKRSSVKIDSFDIVSVGKLRALGYVNYSPIVLDALNLDANVTISPDVSKFRAVREAEANLNGYTNLVLDTNNYVTASAILTTNATRDLKEFYAQIWRIPNMGIPYVEGHDIKYEITEGYVYNQDMECYSTAQTIYTFRVPYLGAMSVNAQSTMTFLDDFNRVRFGSKTLINTILMQSIPFEFDKTPAYLVGPFSVAAVNQKLAGTSFSSIGIFSNNFSNQRLRLSTGSYTSTNTIFNTATRRRTGTISLNNTNTIFGSLIVRYQGNWAQSTSATIFGILNKFVPSNVYLTTAFTTTYNAQRLRTSSVPLTSTNSITATRTLGDWQRITNYSPGAGFSVYSVKVANDYSLVLCAGTTRKLELIDTTTRTLVTTYTMPSGHVLKTPTITEFVGNYLRRGLIAMSNNYVAARTINSSTESVVVFNKNTGSHLYTISSNISSNEFATHIDLTDNILAIVTNDTVGQTATRLHFYQASDGSFIRTDNLVGGVGLNSSNTGKFSVWEDIFNYKLRLYDITGTTPSYNARNTRDDESPIMVSPTYYAYYTNTSAGYALTNGTRPISYDINTISTVTTSRQPDVANYPLTPIYDPISSQNQFNDVYMTDQYIFTTLVSSAQRLGTYVTYLNTLQKADVLESVNGAVFGATDEYLVINGNWYQNTAN